MYHLYVESKKIDTNKLFYKTETDREQAYGYQERKVEGGGIHWEFGIYT